MNECQRCHKVGEDVYFVIVEYAGGNVEPYAVCDDCYTEMVDLRMHMHFPSDEECEWWGLEPEGLN